MNFMFAIVLCLGTVFFKAGAQGVAALHKTPSTSKLNLKSFESLKGRFYQVKVLSELGVEVKTEGKFIVNRKDTQNSIFQWNIEKPKPSRICLDSRGVILTSNGKSKKLTFSEMGQDSSQQMTSLLKLMSLQSDQDLQVDFNIEPQDSGYLLRPKNPEKIFFESALIHISPAGLVDKIFIKEKSRDELKIQFSDLKVSKAQSTKACE